MKILSQMQEYILQEPTFKDTKSKLEDMNFSGLESNITEVSPSLMDEGKSNLSTHQPLIVKENVRISTYVPFTKKGGFK